MLKNLFNSADDRANKTNDPALLAITPTEQQPMFNTDRTTMNGSNAKNQLLAILQDTQTKLDNSNSPASDPLRQNLRRAKELAGFLSVTTAGIDAEQVHQIANKIRQAQTSSAAFNHVVTEIKHLLSADRVLVYELTGSTTGKVVAEALQTGFTPTIGEEIPQIGFGFEQLKDDKSQRAISLLNSQVSPYQKQILEKYQVQSTIAIPILINGYSATTDSYSLDKVWGLLVIQQCSKVRQWSESETNCLSQLSLELTLALQPNQPLLQLSQRRDIFATIDLEARELMQGTLDEMRHTLQADRVMVVAYNSDWSSQVIAESVGSSWAKAGHSLDLDYSINGAKVSNRQREKSLALMSLTT